MAAELPVPTESPESSGAAGEPNIFGLFGLEPEAETEQAEPEPDPEAESSPDTAPAAVTPAGDEWSLDRIEDEKAWTPEKTQEAAAFLRESRAKLEKHWGVSKKKREEVTRDREELNRAQQQFDLRQRTFDANVQALFKGTARERLDALGVLTGRKPQEVLEDLNFGIATDGKESPNREVSELRRQLEEMRAELKKSEEAKQGQTVVERVREGCARAVVDAKNWPEVAERSKADPEGAARQLFAYLQAHPGTTVAVAMDRVELELLREKGKRAPAPAPSGAKTARGAAASRSATRPKEEVRSEPMTEKERLKGLEEDVDRLFGLG